jgi:hypothetical protein
LGATSQKAIRNTAYTIVVVQTSSGMIVAVSSPLFPASLPGQLAYCLLFQFNRFVLFSIARRLSYLLRPKLLIGYLWSHSLLSPATSPTFALEGFRSDRQGNDRKVFYALIPFPL